LRDKTKSINNIVQSISKDGSVMKISSSFILQYGIDYDTHTKEENKRRKREEEEIEKEDWEDDEDLSEDEQDGNEGDMDGKDNGLNRIGKRYLHGPVLQFWNQKRQRH
ncbi:MAG: hypothetical protein EZS28_054402, partial [Streblomastix strix]